MERAAVRCAIVLIAWFAGTSRARAGGFEYGANGAEALGRAGAFVVRGDNPSALYYNVATIGRMEPGTHLLFDTTLVLRDLTFQRDGTMNYAAADGYDVRGMPYPEVKDKAGLNMAPFFALVTDLGLDSDFRFGLGVFAPAAVGRADFPTQSWYVNNAGDRIPIPAPQRYDLLYMDIVFVWPTLAASWAITDDIMVGAAFQSGVINIKFQSMAVAFGDGDAVVADLRANLDVWDWFVPAGIVGAWFRPLPWLETAFSVRISDSISATGDMTTISNPYGVRGQDPVSSDGWTQYDTANGERAPTARLSFAWPMVTARTGIRFIWLKDDADTFAAIDGTWDPEGLNPNPDVEPAPKPPHEREWLDVELDFTYDMTSSVDKFQIKVDGVVPIGYGTPNLAVRPNAEHPDQAGILEQVHNWQDVFTLRLGGDVNLLDGVLSLHWGTSFETSTVPEDWTRLDYAQWMTFGAAGGVTVHLPWYGLQLTASYLHLFMPDREVTDGKARILTSIPREESRIPVINNGTYRTSMDIFSIGVAATF